VNQLLCARSLYIYSADHTGKFVISFLWKIYLAKQDYSRAIMKIFGAIILGLWMLMVRVYTETEDRDAPEQHKRQPSRAYEILYESDDLLIVDEQDLDNNDDDWLPICEESIQSTQRLRQEPKYCKVSEVNSNQLKQLLVVSTEEAREINAKCCLMRTLSDRQWCLEFVPNEMCTAAVSSSTGI
jgi:hypothetical protein